MHQLKSIRDRPTRTGFTLMEVIVAGSIIGIVFLVTIPLLGHVRTVRREADRRTVAQQEAANVMEQVAALALRGPIDPQTVAGLTLSVAADTLPESSLDVAVVPDSGPLQGTRVMVSIGWKTDVDTEAAPVTLTAWFPEGEGEGN